MPIQNYLFLLGLFLFLSCMEKEEERQPNIILIMADDMGAEALASYGNKVNQTPNLDALAAKGILFEQCISQPLCTPSRVKIMTGLHNYRNYEYFGHLSDDQYTFGNLLKENGYVTCIAGKWQLNGLAYKKEIKNWDDPTRPNQFGFDEYCLWQLTRARAEGERFANPLIEQNGDTLPRDPDQYGPDIFADFLLDFIDKNQKQAFFVYYPMVLVHDPFVPTPDSEEWDTTPDRYEQDTAYFKDMVAYTDKIVGKIVSKLQALDIEEETILIFTGDNGTHPRIYSPTDRGRVRGAKGNTITTGTHVPLIISWPEQIKSPFQYEGLIEFSDFFATFADLLEVEVKSDGKSFLSVLREGKMAPIRETAFVHYDPRWSENVNHYRNQFVQTKQYKLYQDGRFLDMAADVLETIPLTSDSLSEGEQEIRATLQQELARYPALSNN